MTDSFKFAKASPSGWRFGADPKAIAAELRRLAAEIEKEPHVARVLVTDIRVIDRISTEDFAARSLIVRFTERDAPAHR